MFAQEVRVRAAARTTNNMLDLNFMVAPYVGLRINKKFQSLKR